MRKTRYTWLLLVIASVLTVYLSTVSNRAVTTFNVRDFGAVGDGKHLNSPAINKAIDAAALVKGTVLFPAGNYRCFSLHLKSNVTLLLDRDALIFGADPKDGDGKYDSPEPNQWDQYQDFGHSHWHNSLIWGENLENISILGQGTIDGKGLVSTGSQSRTQEQNDALRNSQPVATLFGYPNPRDAVEPGWADKAIALKNCRNVSIRDISITHGGHFAILATGVNGLVIDNVIIDTNRDGIDIDSCQNVTISNFRVNAPLDDAIVLKSSFALGITKATENVLITESNVSGYEEGTFLDGTFKRGPRNSIGSSPNGRIKLGTESNGGFKNIKIFNCEFNYSRGLAIELVDGGVLEDLVVNRIKMRDVNNSPIFIRLGNRARGPKNTIAVGVLRKVLLSNFMVTNTDSRYASIISGIPDQDIEGLTLKNINIQYQGGGTKEDAELEPSEKESDYPEPTMFGTIPASGFYIRHVKGLTMEDITISYQTEDQRPTFILSGVRDANFSRIKAASTTGVPTFVLKNVIRFSIKQSPPLSDLILSQRIKLKSL